MAHQLKIGYALEGNADYRLVPVLCERLIDELWPGQFDIQRSLRRTRRSGFGFIKELPDLIRGLEDERVDILVAVVDTGSADPGEWLRRMREGASRPTPICLVLGLAVHEMEAWLLADEVAIARVLGTAHVPRQPDPERVDDPKQRLGALVAEATIGIEHQAVSFYEPIARALSLRCLRDRCSHFERLAQELVDCVQRLLQRLEPGRT